MRSFGKHWTGMFAHCLARRPFFAPIFVATVIVLANAHPPIAGAQVDRQAGYIPNELLDALVDLPLQHAENVFDVYRVIIDLLQEVYPADGEAARALNEMENFIEDHRTQVRNGHARGTVEMPIPIDSFMRTLRENAPVGAGTPGSEGTETNIKAELYTAICLPFLQCRGITYRVRPMVERSYFLHTATIGALRALKQRMEVASGANGLAVFEFLTYPMAHKGEDPIQFARPSDAQVWMEQHLIPTLDMAIGLAEHARGRMAANHQESINLAVFLEADDPFPDPDVRAAHRYFSIPEVEHFISKLYRWRGTLRLLCAYDLDDFPLATNELQQVLTKNFFGELASSQSTPRIGTTSKMRFEILASFPDLFTLRSADHCRLALADFQVAWNAYDRAMRGYVAARPGRRNDRLVNLRWVHATSDEYFNKIAPEMHAVLNGRASLQDFIGGALLDIDLPGALTDPPRDLKDFFPRAFDEEEPHRSLEFSSGPLRYSNYDYGNSVGWKIDAAERSWKKLFPTLSMDLTPEGHWSAPLLAHRDLSRTYVGNLLAPLLWTVIH